MNPIETQRSADLLGQMMKVDPRVPSYELVNNTVCAFCWSEIHDEHRFKCGTSRKYNDRSQTCHAIELQRQSTLHQEKMTNLLVTLADKFRIVWPAVGVQLNNASDEAAVIRTAANDIAVLLKIK